MPLEPPPSYPRVTLPCAGHTSEIAPGGAVRRLPDDADARDEPAGFDADLLGVEVRACPAGGSTRSICPTSIEFEFDRRFQRTRLLTEVPCLRAIWVSVSPDCTR
ncbi:hypothetical protein D3C86_1731170 [compost metagenome]